MGSEKFILGELFGFALLVAGTLVYNEIIEVPIDFMKRNTKANIAKRKEEEEFNRRDLESVGIDHQLDTVSNSNGYSETQGLIVSKKMK